MMMPFWTATPNRAMNPTAVATLSVSPVTRSAISPPSVASGTTPRIITRLAQRPNSANSSSSINPITRPRMRTSRRLGALLVLELPRILDAVLGRVELTFWAIRSRTSAR